MATIQHAAPRPAPWKSAFLTHVNEHMDSPEFVLATLAPAHSNPAPHSRDAPSNAPTTFLPRARFCIFRGFWAELPENKHNAAPRNPPVFESELPTFTTDVRMQKVGELFASSEGRADREELIQGSGGGGPVEAVWWVKGKEDDVMVQWRVKGRAYVIGQDIEGVTGDGKGESGKGAKESSGVRTVKSEVGGRMRVKEGMEGKVGEWEWSRELTGHFGNCSPGMRGSWKNPPPGTKQQGEPDKDHQLGQKVESLDDPIARSNFRVVVIKPDEVESVDIKDPTKAHRKRWTLKDNDWVEETLWP